MKPLAIAAGCACLGCACLGWAGWVWSADPAPTAKPAAQGQKQQVRLHVSGAYCQGCAEVLTEALAQGGVANATKIPANRGRGYVIVLGEIDPAFDLGALAKVVNAADTPHKKQAKPGVALELFASLDDESAEKVRTTLASVKGVDAKLSQVDAETGTISVRLAGSEKVTVAGVIGALKKSAIDAKIVTEGAPAAEKKPDAEKPAE